MKIVSYSVPGSAQREGIAVTFRTGRIYHAEKPHDIEVRGDLARYAETRRKPVYNLRFWDDVRGVGGVLHRPYMLAAWGTPTREQAEDLAEFALKLYDAGHYGPLTLSEARA